MILIIGTVTADILIRSDTPPAELGGDGFRSSNLVFTDEPPAITMGGNGGNSAYVLARLSVPTALCGAVGQDLLGDMLVDRLAAQGVDLSGLTRSADLATSSSTIIMTDAANQVVFHHLGATAAADFESIPPALLDRADALLATSFPLMPRLRAGGFAAALSHVKAAGGITALDIGPAIGQPVTVDELVPLLPAVDHLLANTHELSSLTGHDRWERAADALLAVGARSLVVKQGAQGSSLWTRAGKLHVPGFAVDARITVGAGDSFNVGFLHAVQSGRPVEEALRVGNAVAGLVVAAPRGVLDSPAMAEVETFLESQSAF